MKMDKLKPALGSVKKRKRVGRGPGSGSGKTASKGHKGQNARKGGGVRPGFEGGQTPLFRRLPKRGFKNSRFEVRYNVINVSFLNQFENDEVIDRKKLEDHGLLSQRKLKVKILGDGDLEKKLEIHADKFSKSAIEKIEKAGGKAIVNEKNKEE